MSELEKKSIDPATIKMLKKAQADGCETIFDRAETMKPCPIGAEGSCCKNCAMGPCRVPAPKKKGETAEEKAKRTGLCGATAETISARNFARMVAAGIQPGRCAVITNPTVAAHHLPALLSALERARFEPVVLTAPDGGLYLPQSYPQVDAATLARLGHEMGFEVVTHPPVVLHGAPVSSSRIREALARLPGDGPARVLICGSLYLAGEVLKAEQ